MGRLIDLEQAKEVVRASCKKIPTMAIVTMQNLEKLPTIEPRAKGHWIRHDNADIVEGFYVPKYECSECHAWKEDDSDYCPSCGADMRGEQDDI